MTWQTKANINNPRGDANYANKSSQLVYLNVSLSTLTNVGPMNVNHRVRVLNKRAGCQHRPMLGRTKSQRVLTDFIACPHVTKAVIHNTNNVGLHPHWCVCAVHNKALMLLLLHIS